MSIPAPSNTIAAAPRASAFDMTGGGSGETRSIKVTAAMGVLHTQYNRTRDATQVLPARPPSFFRNSSSNPGISANMIRGIEPGTIRSFSSLGIKRSALFGLQLASALVDRRAIWIQLAENDLFVAVCRPHDLKLGSAATAHHEAHGRRLSLRDFPQHVMIPLHVLNLPIFQWRVSGA